MSTVNFPVHISRVHFPITSLGFGARLGIWFQGCNIRCPGCVSRDTWSPEPGRIEFDKIIEVIEPWAKHADGLTVSGGEPFDQPAALWSMLRWWRDNFDSDTLVFSGYSSETLSEKFQEILVDIDVLISDPFDSRQTQSKPLRGSDNQRMHLLTQLARDRYSTIAATNALDICFDGDTVWIAGIPKPNDLNAIRHRLLALGISAATSNQLVTGVRA
jgi:anaerobic ribonucleoside-triphosphate reductase activating protein